MKTHSTPFRRANAFTLVEMLVTITIIVVLAGLSLGGFNFVTAKQARAKAEIQIKLLGNGLEEYKFENGNYPAGDGSDSSSNDLYKALYWDAIQDDSLKIFVADLNPEANGQGWINGSGGSATIEDPWGNEYVYEAPGNLNPDFDLHSKGPDGETDTAETGDDIANY